VIVWKTEYHVVGAWGSDRSVEEGSGNGQKEDRQYEQRVKATGPNLPKKGEICQLFTSWFAFDISKIYS